MPHSKPSLAVDLALITVADGELKCLMMKRADADKVGGEWALPGGYVRVDEEIDDTVQRVLNEKVGLKSAYLEQLFTYGALDRDPRERVVSVTHFALIPSTELNNAVRKSDSLRLASVQTDWDGEAGGAATAVSDDGDALSLAFDHAEILGDVVKRLRGKLDYTNIALELLPELFTLRQAQEVYEAILGRSLTKPAFRRKLLDRKTIKATGRREEASAFRPAELYTRL
ncbi:NUDIX hydrolase [Ruegeria atlantica]|uniref:NUDIX hydrolase n=1 Tax=Ruegeria atlantica TaxID=81569 RepID=UPI00147F2077|nr:NUDIX domain-containing protein [Ruegeria atlantica]